MNWLGRILNDSLNCFISRFLTIMVNILVIWTPIEAISSYMNFFVFTENDWNRSVQLNSLLVLFFGIICDGAIMAIGIDSIRNPDERTTDGIDISLGSWGRLVIARLLAQFLILGGLVLLLLPGMYLAVRLMFIEQVVIAEGLPPKRSAKRSFALTGRKFWPLAVILLLSVTIEIIVYEGLWSTIELFANYEHWLLDVGFSLIAHFADAYGILCMTFAYAAMTGLESTTPERSDESLEQSVQLDQG